MLPHVSVGDVSKRILLGRKLRSSQLGETLLSKRIALPVFASDALSSVAYAPDEIFIMLAVAGASTYVWSWKIGIVVALVMLTVVASYRQTVHAYPSGGGDYEVATVNLGRNAGVTVASALLVDYVLTVAVSISSAVAVRRRRRQRLIGHEATVAVVAVVVLTAMNLRGVRESGSFFAVPTYLFMVAILGMCAYGLLRLVAGDLPEAESAHLVITPQPGWDEPLTQVGLMFLLARAFSSGCAALTGVEAISNGVPAFRKPKSRNAATTLLLLGLIAVSMMMSVIVLAKQMAIRYVDPHELDRLRTASGNALPDGYEQHPVIAQIAAGVFDHFPPGFYFVLTVTGIILVLAANTAFNGFPVLGSILAQDGLAPRSLGSRGDRLAYSNGIVFLAAMSVLLIWIFDAETTKLIQLYIVGVFVSFNLSQLGMIRHWTRHLKTERDPAARRRMLRSRAINTFGLGMTAVVLVIVLITKFLAGAWITILAMGFFFLLMKAIGRHYAQVELELAADEQDKVMPTRVHAIVLASKLHKPTLRALAFARATRPNVLEAIYVSIDTKATSPAAGGVGRAPPRHPAQGAALALPRGGAPDRRVHPGDPPGQPARRGRGLHPGVRRRVAGGSSCCTTRPPCGSRAGCSSPRASWSSPCPTSCGPRRSRRSVSSATRLRVHAGDLRRGRVTDRDRTGPSSGDVSRTNRPRKARGRSRVGERFEVEVGPVAHGGHCVARLPEPEARVVFVRHALPGERVVLEVTEGNDGDRFWRGDAVSVLTASDRPGRGPVPRRRPRAVRRLRLPARGRARAARPQDLGRPRAAGPARPARRRLGPGRRSPRRGRAGRGPSRRRPALAHAAALRRAPGRTARDARTPLAPPGARSTTA